MSDFDIQTVYHAAAYKHVSMVERNIIEGVRNNVIGTWRVAQAAARNQVEVFVMISTDKAVRPTSVMGASKRLAELVVQGFEEENPFTRFCMVRFGNVLASSGSVVPLFTQQIQSGGPVTVTHKDATRFFMTSSEAAELVIQAGALAEGGEVFVLDMGDLVAIQDLAEKMIHLHGMEVKTGDSDGTESSGTVEIVYTGLKPGEKLFEELVIGQTISGTRHPKILKANEERMGWSDISRLCRDLEQACEGANYIVVKEMLEEHVLGYVMADGSTDPVLLRESKRNRGVNVTPIRNAED
ncbi:MAG: polysaccharide biosynthesis protein, partial [Calditrichaeota bacterium]|nr:polysaccharide biosynthesis protein [Calditrichota bacterium]